MLSISKLLFQRKRRNSLPSETGQNRAVWSPGEEGLAFTRWGGGSSFMIAFSHRISRLPWRESTNLIEAGRDWLGCGHRWKPPWAGTLNGPQILHSSSPHLPLAVAIPSSSLFSLGRIAPSLHQQWAAQQRTRALPWVQSYCQNSFGIQPEVLYKPLEIKMPQPAHTEASGRKIKPGIAFIYKP